MQCENKIPNDYRKFQIDEIKNNNYIFESLNLRKKKS